MKLNYILLYLLLGWLILLPIEPPALAAEWTGIRDGVFYIRVLRSCRARGSAVSWTPAWTAEAQQERIYLQAPDGSLIKRKRIGFNDTSGRYDFGYKYGSGDYRLEIPGYSFRDYQLDTSGALPVVFEPVKVHFSMSVQWGQSFYFKVPAGKAFTLAGKYHEGADALYIEPFGSERRISLKLQPYPIYARFDHKTVAARPRDRVWRISFDGSGKVSFWLDGIPNLFALKPEQLFLPKFMPGAVDATVGRDVIGNAPRIGAYFDFVMPSEQELNIIRRTRLNASVFYFFEDALQRNLNHDLDFLSAYENQLGMKDYVSILSWTTRDSISPDINKSLKFTKTYLRNHRGQHDLSIPYIALVDEPNLRYDSYEAFEHDFVTMAEGLKSAKNPSISSTRIVAPESSRMVNGATLDDAWQRIGLDWTDNLLKRHWDLFDGISWHEWLVRDLIATDWYHDSVERVWRAMIAHAPEGAPLKKLMITQTNMSSGLDLSPYEQDTFYAALWWTSVIAQTTTTGKLAMLGWFKATDSPLYDKGFMSFSRHGGYRLKPVGRAMAFIHPAILSYALPVRNASVEVDMAATRNRAGDSLTLFGVNKGKRRQRVNITLKSPASWRGGKLELRGTYMNRDLIRKPLSVNKIMLRDEARLSFTLAPKIIWVIKLAGSGLKEVSWRDPTLSPSVHR